MIRINLKHIFTQAWAAYIAAAVIIMMLVNTRNMNLHRAGMLQLYADYPIEFLYDESPDDPTAFRQSIRYYTTLEKIFPRLADIKTVLGVSHAQLKNFSRARDDLTRSLRLNPSFFWNRYNLGILEYRVGNLNEAAFIFNEISRLDQASFQTLPFNQNFLNKYDHEIQKAFLYESIRFNITAQYFARLMLLHCLWQRRDVQGVFDNANRFLNQTSAPDQKIMFILWAARALNRKSSGSAVKDYVAKTASQNIFAGNSKLRGLADVLKTVAGNPKALDQFIKNTIPLPDQFLIHPWRKSVLIGREFF